MANFATWNPLAYKVATHTGATYSEGNTVLTVTEPNTYAQFAVTTLGMPTQGKWYAEIRVLTQGSDWPQLGFIAESDVTNMLRTDNIQGGTFANFSVIRPNDGAIFVRGSTSSSSYGSAIANGDIAMLAYDGNTGKVWWGKNGTWFNSGDPVAGTGNGDTMPSETIFITAGTYLNQGNIKINTGQFPFGYTPPSGFVALSTENLAEPPISNLAAEKPEDYFNTVLYTGNGGTQSITGSGFQPDFVWIKARNEVRSHYLSDSVRGVQKTLSSDLTAVEDSSASYVTSFDSDGWSMGATSAFNKSGINYVAWCWKAGGTAVSNTDGSITSQVSANTDAGFSIVSYTGTGANATVGHGLDSAPEIMIIKNRDTTNNWFVYTSSLGATKYLLLNTTAAEDTSSTTFNNIAPTSSVFSVGTWAGTNGSTNDMIAYCWHSVEGFSKLGSYIGNGSTDGSFVYTGFRPAFVVMKRTDTAGTNWTILDNKRNTYNPETQWLYTNVSDAEANPSAPSDFLSNGFKLRTNGTYVNGSGGTYIYMAFAESPYKYSSAR